jgi:hypothetical protein
MSMTAVPISIVLVFAPVVALFLAARFGLWSSGLYLLSGAIVTIAAVLLSRTLHTHGD